ncbi:MAG: LamG-like jellyroll fold domain-containing protein [Desulfamplus sp.]
MKSSIIKLITFITTILIVSFTYSQNAKAYDISTANVTLNGETCTITGTTTTYKIIVTGGTNYITLDNTSIDFSASNMTDTLGKMAFDIQAGTVYLTLSGTNTLKSAASNSSGSPMYGNGVGIRVAPAASLTIDGSGSLTVVGQMRCAGIGGNVSEINGAITINGGNISVTGGAAAIGGGGYAGHNSITINGGTITANGGGQSSAIGSAFYNTTAGTITITGGTVNAYGSYGAAAIGGGDQGGGGTIVISGGTVYARSYSDTTSRAIGYGNGADATEISNTSIQISNSASVKAYSKQVSSLMAGTISASGCKIIQGTFSTAPNSTLNLNFGDSTNSITMPSTYLSFALNNFTSSSTFTMSNASITVLNGGSANIDCSASVTNLSNLDLASNYTVTYNGNGNTSGTPPPPADGNAYPQGSTVTVLGNTGTLAKTGYTFDGWNTALDGTGTTYQAGNTFSMGTANVILYAKWIIPPTYNITISGAASSNGSWSGGNPDTWTPTAAGSTVSASDIQTKLNAGTSVIITTGSGGGEVGDIYLSGTISKTGGVAATLTLKAYRNIVFTDKTAIADRGIRVPGIITSSSSALNVLLNSRYKATLDTELGSVWLPRDSSITTNGGNVTIGGGADPQTGYAIGSVYEVVDENNSIVRGAAVNGDITAGGGNIIINGKASTSGTVTLARGVSISGNVTTTGAGTIYVNGVGKGGSDGIALGDTWFTDTGGYLSGAGILMSENGSITLIGTKGTGTNATNINAGSRIETTGTGNVVLTSTLGNIVGQTGTLATDGGRIIAGGTTTLSAPSTGNITLSHTLNDFTDAVSVNSGFAVTLADKNSLTLGAVNVSGAIDIASGVVDSGDITLTGAVATTDTTSSAVILNAGKAGTDGTAAGGNLIVSTGTVSFGAGGTALLYTGSVSDSTGVTSLSGYTSSYYNSDETSGLTPGAGLFVAYREAEPSPTATLPASGDGTSGNPYQIATLENLYWIAANSSNWNKHYIQTADIDASATSAWDSDAGWTPIGSSTTNFTGVYDGGGHAINNLTINRPTEYNIGLFGVTNTPAEIRNLTVAGNITGKAAVGGIAGVANSGTTIENCRADVAVTAIYNGVGGAGGDQWSDVGGIAGDNYGTIIDCRSSGSVSAQGRNAGGLVGFNQNGTIQRCFSSADVSITNGSLEGAVGGLVGAVLSNSVIENSYASGTVTASSTYTTTSSAGVGGLAGNVRDTFPVVSYSYANGSVTNSEASVTGGLIGVNAGGSVQDSFWDTQTSSQASSAGGTGKTSAEMKLMSTFTNWVFPATWHIDESATTPDNNGYPSLAWQGLRHQVAAQVNNALHFDGTNDIVDVGDVAVFQSASQYTVEAWVKFDGFANWGTVFAKRTSDSNRAVMLQCYSNTGQMGVAVNGGYGYTASALSTGIWYHVAIVYDGSQLTDAERLKFYVNGVSQSLTFLGSVPTSTPASGSRLVIGAEYSSTDPVSGTLGISAPFYGTIDEFRVWNVARTQTNIQNNKDIQLTGTEINLSIYYNFNQGTASVDNSGITTLNDSADTPQNGALWNFSLNGATSNWVTGFSAPASYTITYNGNGNTGGTVPSAQTKTHDAALTLATNSGGLVKSGSTFDGWNTQADGLGTDYTAGATYTANASITLYAKWLGQYALQFDGNDYVEINDHSSLDLTTNYTIEAWIKPTSFAWLGGIVGKYHTTGSNGYTLRLSLDPPYSGINFDEMSTNEGILTLNQWQHIAAVNDNETRKVYVNGVEQTSSGIPSYTVDKNNDPLVIGADFLESPRYFNGLIDEVRIWRVARSQTDIVDNMYIELAGNESGLAAYYNMNEGTGTSLDDTSPNSNIGSINGAAWVVSDCFIPSSYTVTGTARFWSGGGTVIPASQTVIAGNTASLTITPTAGSSLSTVTGCGGSLSGVSPNYTYTTGAINADCEVIATFSLNSYTVGGSVSGGTGGTISPSSRTVKYNSPTTFTITPDWGYHIDSVSGCSGTLSGNIYTTGAVTDNCSVTVVFILNSYTVTTAATANGTITPSGDTVVTHGSTTAFTITPDSGYDINYVLGCGGSVSGTSPNYTYTTGAVTGNCKVIAFFKQE